MADDGMTGDRLRVTADGGATDGMLSIGPEGVQTWLEVEHVRAWVLGDAARAHFAAAAMEDRAELAAILNGRPSPGTADGSIRRTLESP